MKLHALLTELAIGELSNLSFAKTGQVDEAAHAKVIGAINVALNDIFSRVMLSEKEVLVETLDWNHMYYIRPEHSKLDPTPGYLKYIMDTPNNRFTGDIVKVLGVTNEVGDPLPVNDAEQWASIFLPTFDSVQFNHPGASQVFSVQYQALHEKLRWSGEDYLNQEVRVPTVLLDMVKLKTAATILAPMGGQEHTLKAQALEGSYELRHQNLIHKSEVHDTSVNTNVKAMHRGFP